MKYIYGPVFSWRLGRSLGIDLISGEKNCTFDCIYCQIGKTKRFGIEREVFVPTSSVISEFEKLPKLDLDYITFSGTGEPTLAENLGEVISKLKKKTKIKIAVLTNSTLMWNESVRKDLNLADLVVAKLDAPNEDIFKLINKPVSGITLKRTLEGIKSFNQEYPGKLALQIMFVPQNKEVACELASISKEINPVEVQVNTPLRHLKTKPLDRDELDKISGLFKPLKTISVYDIEKENISPLNEEALGKRRPKKAR